MKGQESRNVSRKGDEQSPLGQLPTNTDVVGRENQHAPWRTMLGVGLR